METTSLAALVASLATARSGDGRPDLIEPSTVRFVFVRSRLAAMRRRELPLTVKQVQL
jgi:hypothetical protein